MIRTPTLLLPSLFAVTAAFVAPADTLAFKVEPKAKLSKTFEMKLEMRSTEMSMTFDGEDQSGGMGMPEITVTNEEKLEFTDEYGAIADGHPTKLVRTFDEVAGKSGQQFEAPAGMEMEGGEESSEQSSALQGKRVAFTLKDDEWSAAWPEGEKGDDELLEKLDADLDFVGFLPKKPVSDGDTWELDVKLMKSVMSPGGELHLKDEGEDEDSEQDEQLKRAIEDNLAGKTTATYKGKREEGGVEVFVIEIKSDLTSKGEMDQGEGKAAIESGFELEGEVLWNVKAGHLHAYKLAGKMHFKMDSTNEIDFGGETHEMSQKIRFEGEIEYTAKVE